MRSGVQIVADALGEKRPTVIETHISWVLLSGDRAYKVKKPVRFPFVDYSTPERRRTFTQREFELGRRMSPELYLEVRQIEGEAVLVMRRFPQEAVLDHRTGDLTAPMIEALADEVARVHAGAPALPTAAAREQVHRLMAGIGEDFAEMRSLAAGDTERTVLGRLHAWCAHELAATSSIRRARASGGKVRELHGDLHLRNIVWLDGRPRLFDPIEFNDDFRLIDTASDLAFLVMDLMARGHDEHAQALLARYVDVTQDPGVLDVIRLHLVHRALVRAKVGMIQRAARVYGASATVVRYLALARRLCGLEPHRTSSRSAGTGAKRRAKYSSPSCSDTWKRARDRTLSATGRFNARSCPR